MSTNAHMTSPLASITSEYKVQGLQQLVIATVAGCIRRVNLTLGPISITAARCIAWRCV